MLRASPGPGSSPLAALPQRLGAHQHQPIFSERKEKQMPGAGRRHHSLSSEIPVLLFSDHQGHHWPHRGLSRGYRAKEDGGSGPRTQDEVAVRRDGGGVSANGHRGLLGLFASLRVGALGDLSSAENFHAQNLPSAKPFFASFPGAGTGQQQ